MSAILHTLKRSFLPVLILAAACAAGVSAQQLALNEIMASNNTTLADEGVIGKTLPNNPDD